MPEPKDTETTEVKKDVDVESENTEETPEGTSTTEETDYKALIEAERERAEKAEKALAEDRYKASKTKREETKEDEEDESEDDKPLTKKDLQELLRRERQETEKRIQGTRINEIVSKLTSSADEASYIVQLHRNRTWPEYLTLEEQLEEAHAIANKKTLLAKNAELLRALRGKDGISKDTAGTHRDAPESPSPKINPQLKNSLERSGFTYDTKDKLWKKKLPNGKFVYKDLKSGQIRPL